jgi:hypothetical protein
MNLLILTHDDLRINHKNVSDCDVELNCIRYIQRSAIEEAEVVLFIGMKRIKILKNKYGHHDIVFPFGWDTDDIIKFCKIKET